MVIVICEMPLIKGDSLVATWERYSRQTLSHGFHHELCEGYEANNEGKQ